MHRRTLLLSTLALTGGCALFVRDPAPATVTVTYNRFSVAGSQGGVRYLVKGLELTVTDLPRGGSTPSPAPPVIKQLSQAQRTQVDAGVRAALAEPAERGGCTDSPVTALSVTWPDGETKNASVTDCGSVPATSAITALSSLLASF